MNYLILSTPTLEYGWQLSAALWQLSSPANVQQSEGRETQYWSAPIEYNGAVALPLPDSDEFIHPEADLSNLLPFLAAATDAEREGVAALIASHAGERMSFAEALSAAPSFQSQIRTRAQLEADGWFSDDEI